MRTRRIQTAAAVMTVLLMVAAAACGGSEEPTEAAQAALPTTTPYVPPPTATPIATLPPANGALENGENLNTGEDHTDPTDPVTGTSVPVTEVPGDDRDPIPTAMTEFRPTSTPIPTAVPTELVPTPTPTTLPPTREETMAVTQELTACLKENPLGRALAKDEVNHLLQERGDTELLTRVNTDLDAPETAGLWINEYLIRHVGRWHEESERGRNSWVAFCREQEHQTE